MQDIEILGVLFLGFLCLCFFFFSEKNGATQLMTAAKLIFSGDNHKTCSKTEVYWSVHASHLAVTESNV